MAKTIFVLVIKIVTVIIKRNEDTLLFILHKPLHMAIKLQASIFLFSLLILIGCRNVRNESSEIKDDPQIMNVSGQKQLYMGETDYPTSGTIRYYEQDGKSYVVQCNDRMRTIAVYDYTTGKKVGEKDVSRLLPGGELFAYNSDTIVSTIDADPSIVSFYCPENRSSMNVPVVVEEHHIEQYPRCFPEGAIFMNGKWYFSCYRLGEYPELMDKGKDRLPVLEVDFQKDKWEFIGGYPELYAQNNMGSLNYWVPFICGNTEENKILIGYSASPDIHIYSVKERTTESVSIKSIYADTIPLPLTKKGRDYFSDSDSYYHFAQYPHYGPLCYDPWKRLYYRFVGIGLNDWELDKNPLLQYQKKWSVMIFDRSFKKLGEKAIGDKYNTIYHFVSPEGLYILDKDKNEDIATYSLFTVNL